MLPSITDVPETAQPIPNGSSVWNAIADAGKNERKPSGKLSEDPVGQPVDRLPQSEDTISLVVLARRGCQSDAAGVIEDMTLRLVPLGARLWIHIRPTAAL